MNKNIKILHLDSSIGIYLNTVHKWLYADWTGEQTKESVLRGCELIKQFMQSEQCFKLLNDNSKVTKSWLDAPEWLSSEWFPAISAAGLRNFALVYTTEQFNRRPTVETMGFRSDTCITITFNDLETAQAWLKTV